MSAGSNINELLNLRIQLARQQQADQGGEPYFAAARNSLQSDFRFLLRINGIPFAMISEVSRPNPKFDEVETFTLLNWKFKNPGGIVSWNDIEFTIRETFDNSLNDSIAGIMLNKYKLQGYDNPNQINPNNLKSMSKSALMSSLGDVTIQIIDPDGNVYEQWSLYDAFVSSISFSKLNYNTAGALVGTTVKLAYDWAELAYVRDTGQRKTY